MEPMMNSTFRTHPVHFVDEPGNHFSWDPFCMPLTEVFHIGKCESMWMQKNETFVFLHHEDISPVAEFAYSAVT